MNIQAASRRLCGMSLRAVGLAWLGVTAVYAHAQGPQQTIHYQSTDAEFMNPERGFYKFTELTDNGPNQYDDVRASGRSIVYGLVIADEFRDGPLSQEFLDKMTNGFQAARDNGIKVKFRFAYNYEYMGEDAPLPVVLNHIQQLQPIWEANKDVMFHMDAGFIGKWGEWHGSSSGLSTAANRSTVLHAILDALPVDRTVGMRYPHFKREIFNGSRFSDALKITAENAFDGSDISRVGHLNDCLWTNDEDVGTYVTFGWSRTRELEYIGDESRYAAHGGENCGESSFSDSQNVISEMEILHTDYLNHDYHPDTIQSWQDSGDYDEIRRRLGYRYELEQATLPTAAKPAGLLPLDFTVNNVGFGELFNSRSVEVTLENNTTGEQFSAALSLDPRFWAGGEIANVSTQLVLPENMDEGIYSVGLWMPDEDAGLRDDVRYAIRFANDSTWDETTGINILTNNLVISEDTPGATYVADGFSEVADTADLQLVGDFNFDGTVDAADYTVWQNGYGTTYDGADFLGWQSNLGASTAFAAVAVPEPSTFVLALVALWSPFRRRRR